VNTLPGSDTHRQKAPRRLYGEPQRPARPRGRFDRLQPHYVLNGLPGRPDTLGRWLWSNKPRGMHVEAL